MATSRNSKISNIGAKPPFLNWTIVRGDTASFKVYTTDDAKQPLNIPDWTIAMKVKRPNNQTDLGTITDTATLIFNLYPAADPDDLPGEFTVFLEASQSLILQTGDIFDIQLSQGTSIVWTVAQGTVTVIEDVTD